MNLVHLVRACIFKLLFLQSFIICFSKVKLLSIVMPRNFSLELTSITELSILTILTEKNFVLLNSVEKFIGMILAASDLFHMFAQAIKFYTFQCHILKSTDVRKM